MAKFYPEIEEIKEKYTLSQKEKDVLNQIFKLLKNRDEIEIHVQKIIFNQSINILVLTKNEGIFFITENEISQPIFLGFFDTYLELKNRQKNEPKIEVIKFLDFNQKTEDILEVVRGTFVNDSKFSGIQNIFSEQYYYEIKSKLYSKFNESTDDILINFDSKQEELILKRENFKVKGTAGSGKTAIIIEKCVRDYREFQRRSLIVVFNITARNHIRQKLYNLYKNIDRSYFKIVHYHALSKEIREEEKFDNILIDEAQDFEREWYDHILKGYLKSGGNFYIFGDEKQNIYERKLDEKNISTPISGAWNQLKVSYRSESVISELALQFQKKFFESKYSIDEFEIKKSVKNSNLSLEFSPQKKSRSIDYKYFTTKDSFENSIVIEYIKNLISKNNFQMGETAIVCTEVDKVLLLMKEFGEKIEKIGITMETFEENESLKTLTNNDKNQFDRAIQSIRRNRKLNFEIFGDFIVFSTIHSFKGFERDNVIFIISEPNSLNSGRKSNIDELVYTGITRAKENLCIINVGVDAFNDFFNSEDDYYNYDGVTEMESIDEKLENWNDSLEDEESEYNSIQYDWDRNEDYNNNNIYDGATEMGCTDGELEDWFESAYERYG